jgi:hypothetical protein
MYCHLTPRRKLRRWRPWRARRATAGASRQQRPSRRPKIDGKNVPEPRGGRALWEDSHPGWDRASGVSCTPWLGCTWQRVAGRRAASASRRGGPLAGRRTAAWSGSNQSPAVANDTGYARRPPHAVVGHRDRWLHTQASEGISYGVRNVLGWSNISLVPMPAQRLGVSCAAGRRGKRDEQGQKAAASKGRGAARGLMERTSLSKQAAGLCG